MTWGHVLTAIAGGVIVITILIFWAMIAEYRDFSRYMKDDD